MTDEPKDAESVVERVARVIEFALDRHGVMSYTHTLDDAIAAITEMREPTEAMCRAPEENRTIGARRSYQAMIDAALAGGRP